MSRSGELKKVDNYNKGVGLHHVHVVSYDSNIDHLNEAYTSPSAADS